MIKLKQLGLMFVSWRMVLFLVAFLTIQWLPFRPRFPYSQAILEPLGAAIIHRWGNFDGVHYLTIVEKGYKGTGSIQAFFPVYPLLVRATSYLVGNPLIAGLIVSHVSLIVALWLLVKLVSLDEDKEIALKTVILVLAFPTAFFFGSMYTESLFLLLVIGSFYAARKKHWLVAGIIGAVAAATRVVGVLIVPALVFEWWQQTNKKKRWAQLHNGLAALLPIGGLWAYMRYLSITFNDALLFLHVQPTFGAGREDRIILLYQVFWRYVRMVVSVAKNDLLFYAISQEFLVGILFLILVILTFYKTRISYALFAALAYLAPTLTGTFSSLPRYVLVLFPAFIVMSKVLRSKLAFYAVVVFSGILQIINTVLFISGYWIA